jgi:predicted RNA-binding Zn-ribbon protein involved in translation (DUF1610 family)
VSDEIPEDSVSKSELHKVAKYKCPQCGAYGLNRPITCSGFGGDPGDDSMAHAPIQMVPNPDRST